MIKLVKRLSKIQIFAQKEQKHNEILLNNREFRKYIEIFESELNRGISILVILNIIKKFGKKGTYGYQLKKNLKEQTQMVICIEDGTLYPILHKIEENGIINSEKIIIDSRLRKYYHLTEKGLKILRFMEGYYLKLIETIAPILNYTIEINKSQFLFCSNCSNKIEIKEKEKYCEICGLEFNKV